ncbi:MAG: glycosyltransferase family 2 protein [Thiohalomonadales bacterium]
MNVVIPNFNGVNLLRENLPTAFAALEFANIAYRIIVVDDCSTDDSVSFLRNRYPEILIIKLEQNVGFSQACNRGLEYCVYNLTCIVNTDAAFDREYFTKSIKYFVRPDLFAVKGEIQNFKDSIDKIINIEQTSKVYYSRGFLRFNQKIEPEPERLTAKLNEQFVLLGCCFVCDTEKMKLLKGYDVRYSPYYWEDADLAFRAIEMGYRLVYASECKVQHNLSSTISHTQSNTKRRVISIRNKFQFTWRHMPGRKYWINHSIVVVVSIFIRWLKLDWKYYYCLFLALKQTWLYRDSRVAK